MTSKRVKFLQELLGFVGLGDRLRLEWISSAEAQKFAQVVTSFTDKIKGMGPSPLATFVKSFQGVFPENSNKAHICVRGAEEVLGTRSIQ